MRVLDRWLRKRADDGVSQRDREQLSTAEALLRAGGAIRDIRARARQVNRHHDVDRAWAAVFQGNLDEALRHGYATANERPYDVDSRIVHGTVRLARNELEHAEHEFDAVIEEFGAEADAIDGKRAVILAHGFAPLDELPATDDDWSAAATLLTTLWRLAGVVSTRMDDLAAGNPDGINLIARALADGQARDMEDGNGSV